MKVGAGTRNGLRTLFEEHELCWDWPDAVLDAWVRSARSQLGRRPNSLEDEQTALVKGLLPVAEQFFQLQALSDASSEVWNGLMWEVLQVCVAKTQSAQRFPFMLEAENDAWEEVVAALLDRCEGTTREHQLAWWHFACAAWTGAVLIGMLLWFLPMSGRRTLTSITVAMSLVGIGEAWRRYGYDIPWGRTVELLGSERPPSLQPIPNDHSGERDASPVLLQKTAPTKSADDSSVKLFPALGSLVQFNEGPRVSAVKNSFGVVTGVSSVDVTVTLAGGARVEKVRPDDFVLTSLDEVPGGQEERNRLEELMLIHVPTSRKQTDVQAAPDPPPHYTPLAEGTQAQHQAKSIKELLVLWHGKASLQPAWARSFWAEVGRREPLEPRVRTLLLSHGYLGQGVGSPPRVKELKEKLEELSIAGALAHTTSAFRDQDADPWPEEAGLDTWDAALPPDLKRAGPEIYTSMKSAGVRCVRDWINSMFSVDQRQHPQYVELFNLASLVDFKVRDAGSPAQVLSMIGQCDTCEIALRRLASWIHEKRTGDKDAAQSMLAVKPSSFASDIAPSWLVTEASTYSQSEYKRKERARAQWTESTKGKGKKGKDKGKKSSSGKGFETPQS